MGNLFNKGSASESTGIQASNSWYIHHHRVYHPHKPDKKRVTVDCSSEFQGRTLKLVFAIVCQFFIFSPSDSP